MNWLVDWVVDRSRLTMSLIVAIVLMGTYAYIAIPKESDPDIPIPFVSVTVFLRGVSPEDSERLLIRPMETQLKTVEGLKQMRATAGLGYGGIVLEFDVNFDKDKALTKIREKVDLAKAELPADAEEPVIQEINIALQPAITVILSGDAPERTLLNVAKRLEKQFETLPGVLEANLQGAREELLEVIIDPARVESFGISADDLFSVVRLNNQLVPAGALDTGKGRFQVKVPGLFETADDVLRLPVKVSPDGAVVTLRDIADVRRTFQDATSFARYNGKPSISIEVTKRIGANIVSMIEGVKKTTDAAKTRIPPGITVQYSGDQSYYINAQLTQLTNAILLAIVLVMTVVVAILGLRSGLITGFSIPASFLIGFLALYAGGYTLNLMILFGLVITVGLLVDNAIIVTEYADRKMIEGFPPNEAFREASKRMFWPVVSSTATTLAAFAPMLFWPGVSGKFMGYLPLTMIYIMTASMVVSLLFLPTIGALLGKAEKPDPRHLRDIELSETGNVFAISGMTGWYAQWVRWSVYHPIMVILLAVGVMVAVFTVNAYTSKGLEFFVETDVDQASLRVRARGNLSAAEKRDLLIEVERRVIDTPGLKGVNAFVSSGGGGGGFGGGAPVDTIGQVFVELKPYGERGPSKPIMNDIRKRVENIPGIYVELFEFQGGPPTGKAIQIEVGSENYKLLDEVTDKVRKHVDGVKGLMDIEDSRPLPGIEWALTIDREQAGRFGANVASVGATVQLVTTGVLVGKYRPDDAEDEVDIRVRFPSDARGLGALDRLRVNTRDGSVPITNFVTRAAKPQVNRYERVDGVRVWQIRANISQEVKDPRTQAPYTTSDRIAEIRDWIEKQNFDPQIRIIFRGADEQQQESAQFLAVAFLIGLLVIGGILIIQFNNFWHAIVILSAVILSVTGVVLGLIIEQQKFSVIMTGTGAVALIGVMVNHNIVLVDTFHQLLAKGFPPMDAIVRTGVQRLRPVILTTVTAILGLLPLMYKFDVDFFERSVHFGGPVSDWWVPLATAIVYGLGFSTLLTLLVTPAMLALEHKYWSKERKRWGQWSDAISQPAE
jgi:multidrug efflux pump